jgi:hypothetical protein
MKSARLAGILYLIVIVAGFFAEIGARQRVVAANDAAATAANILAHESLFRWGFASDLIAVLAVVPLILLLYELLKVVNRQLALLALFFSLVGTAVQSTSLLGHIAPLILLKRGAALGVSPDLLQAQSYMAIQLQGIGYAIALAFFGGTMLTRGYLILRSTFLPAFIGVLLLLAGPAYILSSFVLVVAPAIAGYAMALLIFPFIGETSLALWLLVKGVNVAKWEEARRAATISAA